MYPRSKWILSLNNRFNNTKPTDAKFKDEYFEYYRILPEQFDVLATSEDKEIFCYHLENLGIIEQWKQQAQQAIKLLEKLTGKEFVNDSKKSQYTPLTKEKRAEIQNRIKTGYYKPEQIQARKNEKLAAQISKIKSDLAKDKEEVIKNALAEYNVKIAVLEAGIDLKNFIYYKYSNEAVFNWLSYEPKITQHELDRLIEFVKNGNYELPKNIVFKLDTKNR